MLFFCHLTDLNNRFDPLTGLIDVVECSAVLRYCESTDLIDVE